jgi:hypothetical protein
MPGSSGLFSACLVCVYECKSLSFVDERAPLVPARDECLHRGPGDGSQSYGVKFVGTRSQYQRERQLGRQLCVWNQSSAVSRGPVNGRKNQSSMKIYHCRQGRLRLTLQLNLKRHARQDATTSSLFSHLITVPNRKSRIDCVERIGLDAKIRIVIRFQDNQVSNANKARATRVPAKITNMNQLRNRGRELGNPNMYAEGLG